MKLWKIWKAVMFILIDVGNSKNIIQKTAEGLNVYISPDNDLPTYEDSGDEGVVNIGRLPEIDNRGHGATHGTIRSNRVEKCLLMNLKQFGKFHRGKE